MVFSSIIFLFAFLPLNLICYYAAPNIKSKNIILLIFSLIFYAWGEPVYILLLLFMSAFCWICSLRVQNGKTEREKKIWMLTATVVSIGVIGVFKYSGFFVENIASLIGAETSFSAPALPLGISFYTFQLLTYVVDVYRGEVPAQRDYYKVLLYAGLFHQCVAGPIVRYGDIENELTNRYESMEDINRGITRFTFGLAKKAVLANGCGAVVDTLLLTDDAIGNASLLAENLTVLESRSALTLWIGMAFYMLQIYLDFSSYSDMAIGLGLMCGFHYKENFDYPYISLSVTEFWRRWHISLGTFFRDYVYIPLGGNRKGKLRQTLNMFVVWGLTGLWHGAGWNFILWGLYFFVLLTLEKHILSGFLKKHKAIARCYLLAAVYFGWVFFKFTDMGLAGAVFKGMFCLNGNAFWTYEIRHFALGYVLFFTLSVLACTPFFKNVGKFLRRKARTNAYLYIGYQVGDILLPVLLLLTAALSVVGDSYNPFLYFRF